MCLSFLSGYEKIDARDPDSDNNHLFCYYLSFKQQYSLNSFGIDVINSIIL
jgi:hypothetical protein